MEETVTVDFCILSKDRIEIVHISHILALTQYAISLSCFCRTRVEQQTWTLDSESFKTRRMLRSCPSHSVQPITEPASIKIVVEFTLLNVLNSLHSYTQTQKLYRGKMTGITSFSAGFEGTVIWLIWFLCSVLTRENMKICEIDLNHFHKCVSVDICCLTCWLTHRLTRASTKCTGNVCFWMDHGDERWQEYSFMAWHEIIICFLYTCTCWFYFLMLFKKKKKDLFQI